MSNQLPQYKCHKIVGAGLIIAITLAIPAQSEGNANAQAFYPATLTLDVGNDVPMAEVSVDADWMAKNRAAEGGYFVVYEGGYTSYSPAEAFEAGYTLVDVAEAEEEAKIAEIIASVRAEERQRMLDELAASAAAQAPML